MLLNRYFTNYYNFLCNLFCCKINVLNITISRTSESQFWLKNIYVNFKVKKNENYLKQNENYLKQNV